MSFKTNDAPDQDQDQATTTLAHGGCLCLTDVTVKDSSGRACLHPVWGRRFSWRMWRWKNVDMTECVQARRDGMSLSSERIKWGASVWIHDDRPSHQLHFSPQQACDGVYATMEKERPCMTTKDPAWRHPHVVAPSTSTNLAFSTTCPMETRDKISAWKGAAPFTKKQQKINKFNNNKQRDCKK